jgi:hypothetical protein
MLLWAGQGVSLVGDFVLDITIVLWISTVIARGLSIARPLRDAESGQATEPAEEVPSTPAPG